MQNKTMKKKINFIILIGLLSIILIITSSNIIMQKNGNIFPRFKKSMEYSEMYLQKYNISFELNGAEWLENNNFNNGNISGVVDSLVTEPIQGEDFDREGFTIEGWYTDEEFSNKWDFSTDKISQDMTLYAKWTRNKYRVNFYNQYNSTIGQEELLWETEVEYGYTFVANRNDSEINEIFTYHGPEPERTNYKFIDWISSTGSYVVTEDTDFIARYTSETMYAINVNYIYQNGEIAKENYVTTRAEEQTYSIPIPEIEGYTPSVAKLEGVINKENAEKLAQLDYVTVEWDINDSRKCNIDIDIMYVPAQSNYTVKHWKENINDSDYTLADVITYSDNVFVGDKVTAETKEYEGFHLNEEKSTIKTSVDVEGKTVINVYYDRDIYYIYPTNTGDSYYDPIPLKYEQEVVEPTDPIRQGYDFNSWTWTNKIGGEALTKPNKMPTNSLYATANWTEKSTTYILSYYVENADDNDYTNVGSSSANLTSGYNLKDEDITNDIQTGFRSIKSDYAYFTYDEQKTKESNNNFDITIAGDGSTVVPIYFSRNYYNIEFTLQDSSYKTKAELTVDGKVYTTATVNYTFTAKYEQNISDLWPTVDNFTILPKSGSRTYYFNGWRTSSSSSTSTSKRVTLTSDLMNSSANNSTTTYTAVYITSNSIQELYYMFESFDQTTNATSVTRKYYNGKYYDSESSYHQIVYSTATSWSAKQISGMTNVGKENENASINGTSGRRQYFYYDRQEQKLTFYNVNKEEQSYTLKHGQDISGFADLTLTPDQYPIDTPGDGEYMFNGWYRDSECTIPMKWVNENGESEKLNDNLVLYASWIAPEYQITFNVNNGKWQDTDTKYNEVDSNTYTLQIEEGNSIERPVEPKRTGYVFAGWYYMANIDGQLREVEYMFDKSQKIYSNVELIAKWSATKKVSYKVKYIKGETDADGRLITDVNKYSEIIEIADEKVVNDILFGETISETAINIINSDGEDFYVSDARNKLLTLDAEDEEDNVIYFFYLSKTELNYTIYYVKYNGSEYAPGDIPDENDLLKEPVTKTITSANGTYVTERGISIPGYVIQQQLIQSIQLISDESKNTIYFYYKENQEYGNYIINCYFMNQKGGYSVAPDYIKRDTAAVGTIIKSQDYERLTGLSAERFEGYELDEGISDSSSIVINEGDSVTLNIYFKNIICNITYKTQGGIWWDQGEQYNKISEEEYKQSVVYSNSIQEPQKPTKEGNNRFLGWYYNADDTTTKLEKYTFNTPITKDITLYAVWMQEIDIKITKVWEDDSNRDGIRPEAIDVNLLKADKKDSEIHMTIDDKVSDNTWEKTVRVDKYQIADVEDLNSEMAIPVKYTLEEKEIPNGYIYTYDDENYQITNTHNPEIIDKTATKIWRDGDNKDNTRPDSVKFQLKENGINYGEIVTLTAADEVAGYPDKWAHTWTGLYKYEHGKEIEYTVEEIDPPTDTYSVKYVQKRLEVYNAYPPEVDITTTINWDDGNDKDGIRPSELIIQLQADGVDFGDPIIVNEENNWNYMWEYLEKYNSQGEEYKYQIKEIDPITGYTTTYNVNDSIYEHNIVVNNTHIPEKTSKTVTKIWQDNNDQDGIRPQEIKVQLKANDEDEGEPVILNDNNNWTYTWESIDKNYNKGQEVNYTVTEVDIPEGYEVSYDLDKSEITNTHIPYKIQRTVTKVWEDKKNEHDTRPEEVIIRLKANGEYYGDEVILNEANNWKYTYEDLDKCKDGKDIEYAAEEITSNDYYDTIYSSDNLAITNRLKKYKYKIEYYYDGIKDDSSTETLNATYQDVINNYTDKVKDGYEFSKTENLPLTITEDETTNIIKVYYQKRSDLSYTVKYLEKDSNIEIATPKVVNNQVFESVITENAIEIDGYNKGAPETQEITIGTGVNEIIFYYTKRTDIGYTIEYYYDGIKDETVTEKGVGTFESQIDTYIDKNRTGYKFEKVEGKPITLVTDEAKNIMKVYYVRDTFGYTVEYYYDGIIDNSKTDTFTGIYGDVVNIYTDKNITGYKLEKTENNPLTITEIAENNVMKVYYVKDKFNYTVEYYYNDIKDKANTDIIEATYQDVISNYTDKIKDGYEFSRTENLPLTVSEDETTNVIKVYYVKRSDLSYKVKYLEKDSNIEIATEKVVNNQVFESVVTENAIEIDGYNKVAPETQEITIGTGVNEIIFYYTKRTDIGYTIEYYYDGIKDETVTETGVGTYESQIDTYIDKNKTGYKFERVEGKPITLVTDETQNIMKIYYVRDTFGYTVEYYYDGIIDNSKTDTFTGTYGDVVNIYTDKNITGYKLEKTENNPLTITEISENNVMKVYYVKDRFNYTVEYYYNDVKDEANTDIIEATYQDVINNYTDKVKDGYEFSKTENLPLTITEDETTNIIKVYYQKRSDLSYTVKYLEKDSNIEIATPKVVNNQVFESVVIENAIEIDGYNKVAPETQEITIGTGVNEIIFYYTKRTDIGYTIEYYYDGIKDETVTEKGVGTFESQIDTYIDKNRTGYKFEKVEGKPITLVTDETQNIMKVYYVRDTFGYTVEYYYDGIIDNSKTDTFTGTYGDVVNTYTDKNITGYKLEKTENNPLTITEIAENNVMKVYYVKDKFNYTVEYYYNDIKDEANTDIIEATYQDVISNYTDKVKDGYEFSKTENLPLTVSEDETTNVIKVYYVKRSDLSYTVKYLEKDTKQELAASKVVNNQVFESAVTENAIEIEGYNKVAPETQEITIGTGVNEIIFYYTKRTDLSYTVNYYEEGTTNKLAESKVVEDRTFKEQITENAIDIVGYTKVNPTQQTITIEVNGNEINFYYRKVEGLSYTVNYYEEGTTTKVAPSKDVDGKTFKDIVIEQAIEVDGYNKVEPTEVTIEIDVENNIIDFYYTKRTDLSYTVKYLEQGTNKELHVQKDAVNQVFADTITETAEVINGYNLVGDNTQSITITTGTNEIIFYYTKRTDIGYTIEYYYDGIKDETVTETGVGTYESQIDTYIDKNKTGYKFERVEGKPITLVTDEAKNIMKVYYVRDTFGYTVEYYYDGIIDNSITDTFTGTYGDVVNTYTDKNITGYKLEKTENNPLTITEISENNVMKVYYVKDKFNYTVEYYYNDVKDEANTDIIEATYQDVISNYTDKVKDGYEFSKTEKLPLTVSEDETTNVIKVYYIKRSDLSYTVKYLEKDTEQELAASKVVNNQVFESAVTENAIEIDGYNKVAPETQEITIGIGVNEIIFYYTKRTDIGYTIEYYYDGIKDETVTETGVGTFESQIDTYTDKNRTGYKFEKVKGKPITLVTDETQNIMKVYYVRDTFGYTVEYYYDGIIDNSKTDTFTGTYGDVVNTYTDKNITGYKLEKTENNPLTITEISENNVMKVYYVKDKFNYTVEYYYNDIKDEANTDIIEATYQDVINNYADKVKDGYEFSRTENLPLTVSEDETANVIKVYYIKRSDLSYTVKYLEKDTEQELAASKVINNQVFESVIIENAIEIDGYNKVAPETQEITIGTGVNEIIFYYTKRTDIGYTIEYYYDGIKDETVTETGVGTFESQIDTYIDKNRTGYKFEKVEGRPITLVTDEAKNIMKVYYVKDVFEYRIEYYYDGTINNSKTDTFTGTYGDIVNTYTDKNITGYKLGNVEGIPLTISEIPQNNVIKVYYVRDIFGYTVEYYYAGKIDSTKTDTIQATFGDNITTYTDKVVDGYVFDKTENLPLTVSEDVTRNIIKVYYKKRTDLSYTVKYLEKETGKVLYPQKDISNKTFEEIITETAQDIEGYNLIGEKQRSITIGVENNVITFEYTKRTDLSYTVKYIDKDTKEEIADTKTVNNRTFEEEITETAINIDGYNLFGEKTQNITIAVTGNEIIFEYTKRADLSYTVKYVDQDTGKTICEDKIVDKQIFNSIVTENAITIDGYNLASDERQTLKIRTGANIIIFNYTKKNDLSYTVKYLEQGTEKELSETKVKNNQVFDNEITEKFISIDGYNLVGEIEQKIRITTGINEIIFYYTKRTDLSYTVKYLERGTEEEIKTEKIVNNQTFEALITETAPEVYGYDKLDPTTSQIQITTGENIIRFYYSKKVYNITTEVKGVGGTISGQTDSPYETVIHGENSKKEIKILPEYGYRIKSITINNVEIKFTPKSDKTFTLPLFEDVQESKHVVVEFEKMESKLTVKYVDKYTNEEISEQSIQEGFVGDNYDLTNYEKEIENYTLIDEPNVKVGTLTEEEIVVTYYYAINSRVVVNYIDKYSNKNLETITEDGYEGKVYTAKAKDYEGYVLVEKPEIETVTMTREEIILNYYYLHVSKGVVEKHIDIITGETLYNETHEGREGTPYDIKSKEFEGYDLVEDKLPDNSKGEMTKGVIEVRYYYVKKAKLVVSHTDIITNEKLAEDEVLDYHDGDEYTTQPKEFEGYVLTEMPANSSGVISVSKNPDGTYNITTEVKYYYVHISKGVVVRYVDKTTEKDISEEKLISGNEGDKYTTEPITIEGYDLIESPENATGNMSIEKTEVVYYYIKKTSITVKYIDEYTNEELLKEIVISGHEGDEYKAETKVFEGYDLKEVPENAEGNMGPEPTEVIYYYRRKAIITVKYVDKDTKDEIDEKVTIDGYYGEEYEIKEKDIKFYKLVEAPKETKDKFAKDKAEFVYYYEKLSFNMSVEKKISAIILDGERKTVGNGKLEKVEIYRKNVDTSTLYIEYIIKVRNTGEIEGNATVIENIPQGLEFVAEQSTGWTQNGSTATYKIDKLGIGETKELKVVMKWRNSSVNFGPKENIANLNDITNEAKYEETNEKDNEDNATIIIGVSTGTSDKIVQIIVGMLDIIILTGTIVLLVTKKQSRE